MSIEARQALVDNPKLHLTDSSQRSDLLDPNMTSTYLIAMLQWMMDNCPEPIELTAVRSDHPSQDGPWAHSGGKAVDCYPVNWSNREEAACTAVMKAFADNPYCEAVGLGGVTQQWSSYVTWPQSNFWFEDNDADHIHAGCASSIDVNGGARLAGQSY